MSERDDNFLSRWSRRKAQVRQGVEPPPAAEAPSAAPRPVAVDAAGQPGAAGALTPAEGAVAANEPSPASPAAVPKPTLEEAEALTPESDFTRFVSRDVDERVKNSALKKLFADPHFNVMDGLDTYIDDYNTPTPLPKSVLRQMVQARMLGLLDDELPEQPLAGQAATVEAQEAPASEAVEAQDAAALPEAAVGDGMSASAAPTHVLPDLERELPPAALPAAADAAVRADALQAGAARSSSES